jgi:YidC/Oxa1 family membrane protein insertase
MIPLPLPTLALLLQSNQTLSQILGSGQTLPPDPTAYTGITGMFAAMFLSIISLIAMLVHNHGLAIILTVFVVRLALLPLTFTQIRGMKVMQLLQPVMKEIQRFYPNKQEQSSKMMELYQTYKINPLAGCLPMLIQLPIMFGVYRALYDPSFVGKDFLGIQLMFPVNVTGGRSFSIGPDMADLIDITIAKLDLYHQIIRIPQSIPLIGGGFWYWPALLLVVLYVVSSILMQRRMRQVNQPDPSFAAEFKDEMKSRPDGTPEPDMAQQMQRQMGMMNFMLIIFAFIFSSGALLYFIVQNFLMILEYTLLPKRMQLALDPKELKAFVRRPPQAATPGQPGAKPPVKGVDATGRPVRDETPALAQDNPTTSAQEDGLEDDDRDDNGAAALRRPRKKRRKK